MIRKDEIYWARWLFLPCALLGLIFIVPCGLSFIQGEGLKFYWLNGEYWVDVVACLICGAAWVMITFRVAPDHKLAAAIACILPGIWLSWLLMGTGSYYRIGNDGEGYYTSIPTYLSWWSALLGLFLVWKRSKVMKNQPDNRHLTRKQRLAILGTAILLFSCLVLPTLITLARFIAYRRVRSAIESGDEQRAIRELDRQMANPFFNLDWNIASTLNRIPFGRKVYLNVVGCDGCKGDISPLLRHAAQSGLEQVVAKILTDGGSVDHYGDKGMWVLIGGIASKNTNVINLLIRHGADVNATSGWSPGGIMNAAVIGLPDLAVIETLVSAGADVNATNWAGKTPLDQIQDLINITKGTVKIDSNVVEFLVQHGARNGTNLPVRGGQMDKH